MSTRRFGPCFGFVSFCCCDLIRDKDRKSKVGSSQLQEYVSQCVCVSVSERERDLSCLLEDHGRDVAGGARAQRRQVDSSRL